MEVFRTDDEQLKRRAALEVDPVFPVGLHGQPDPEAALEKMLRFADFIVAVEGEEVAGMAAIYANDMVTRTAYVTLFGVKEAWQRRRVGAKLLEVCEALACERGMERFRLEVTDWNLKAVRFYTRAGFIRTGPCEEDSSYMEKLLQPAAGGAGAADRPSE